MQNNPVNLFTDPTSSSTTRSSPCCRRPRPSTPGPPWSRRRSLGRGQPRCGSGSWPTPRRIRGWPATRTPWGMKVNPYYSTKASVNPSGVPFGSPRRRPTRRATRTAPTPARPSSGPRLRRPARCASWTGPPTSQHVGRRARAPGRPTTGPRRPSTQRAHPQHGLDVQRAPGPRHPLHHLDHRLAPRPHSTASRPPSLSRAGDDPAPADRIFVAPGRQRAAGR